ncbi:MAG: uridine kinase, partial [Variovorax sp.]|nr:uridine kinase [Variovorax sp.]
GQFIKPQRDHAQLVLSLLPTNPRLLETATDPSELRFRLLVRSPHGFHEDALVRSLVAICGLHVDVALDGDNSTVEMRIEGETHAEDIALAAKALVPQLLPLLKRPPRWHDGITGLMQLIVLAHLNEAVRRRLL